MSVEPIDTAPRDGREILIETADFGWVNGRWDAERIDFYKSQKGWASYDPENMQGTWVSTRVECCGRGPDGEYDPRLFCGATPKRWMPKPPEVCHDCGAEISDERAETTARCGSCSEKPRP